jgi:Fe-S-cluster containining protein
MISFDKMKPIYWTCLGKDCPTSCCDSHFGRKGINGVWGINDESIPITHEECQAIIQKVGIKVPIKLHKDFIHYIEVEPDKACFFWKNGLCSIQDVKPAICKAYPFMDLYSSLGAAIDPRCPGVAEGERLNIRMNEATYKAMIKGLIVIANFRLQKLMKEVPEENPPEYIRRGQNVYKLERNTPSWVCGACRYG